MNVLGNLLLCIAIPLLILLPFIKGNVRHYFVAFLSGMCACLFAGYIDSFLMVTAGMSFTESARFLSPITEELLCLVPCIFYLLIDEPSAEGLMSFGVALGAGFATFENACYIASNGAESMQFVLIRGAAAGVMHVVCGLILGIGLAVAKEYRPLLWSGLSGILAFTVSLHSIYNLYVSADGPAMYAGFCIPIICAVVILIFAKRIKTALSKTGGEKH